MFHDSALYKSIIDIDIDIHISHLLIILVQTSKENSELTSKIDIQAVGPSAQGKTDHRCERPHTK